MIRTSISSEEAADLVASQPAPVLFLDSAAILDIPRVLYRQELQLNIVEACVAIIKGSMESPKRVWILATENVVRELQDNRNNAENDLIKWIRDFNKSMARFFPIVSIALPERPTPRIQWPEQELADRIWQITDNLIGTMIVFRGSPRCVCNARNRIWDGKAPASKSKQEFKDCEIFEEFLEFMAALRARGITKAGVFVTPNKHDYGQPPEGELEIASDLKQVSALYTSDVAWAWDRVKSGLDA